MRLVPAPAKGDAGRDVEASAKEILAGREPDFAARLARVVEEGLDGPGGVGNAVGVGRRGLVGVGAGKGKEGDERREEKKGVHRAGRYDAVGYYVSLRW
jgi:hypothetical protein